MTQHILFLPGLIESPALLKGVNSNARLTRYGVEVVRSVTGPAPAISPGAAMLRVESPGLPFEPCPHDGQAWRGVVQHQNYTAARQRAELDSIGPFAETKGLHCVLIPIHKAEAWWQLPADERTGHFHRTGEHQRHAAIGAPYVRRIHRRLFHSRYCGGSEAPIPYDFLTYFEFPEHDRAAFEDLLAGLRDRAQNPEWAYVDSEYEIWMRRLD